MEYIVNFGGWIGADNTYFADSEDEALEYAFDDLDVIECEQIDNNEWCVTVGFCGYIGVENEYTVIADDEAQAYDEALEEARWDLEVQYDEDEDEDY